MSKFLVEVNKDSCKGCELCTTVCSKDLLHMDTHVNSKGYAAAYITKAEMEECIGCINCAIICPEGSIEIFKLEEGERL